jgi:hypothetical protein
MPPAFPTGVLVAHQAQVCLVDQGRRLQGLAGLQLARQRRRQAAQLGVDFGQQIRGWLILDRGLIGALF